MNSLSLLVQEKFNRDPHSGDLFVFRGARGDKIKAIWFDDIGHVAYLKRLERGMFIWPQPVDGVISISSAQLGLFIVGY